MRKAKTTTLVLTTAYGLSSQARYITKTYSFELGVEAYPELQQLQQLELCLHEKQNGGVQVIIGGTPPPQEIPEQPEPDEAQRFKSIGAAEDVSFALSRINLPPPSPTLPENPTAELRWQYLLDVLKQKAAN